ncbi:hypothetical protein AXF42_Ash013788 [Apostasia shenzhenica]|uniref:Uncharacterized protein n=1 Tax=Apostasia shenzhenica TaxID=1088818 RepID=A0A2I0A4W6_9ASPA|nr:hypothetical protein AXF42_Ash013788 [Apostasia shenzhenica]
MSSPSSLQWLSLVGTIWLQTLNGANSDFPVYSSQLKQLLSISQIQLNNLAFASDAGKLFGWVSGFAATFLPLRLVLLVGAIFSLIGYGFQFLFLANKISHLSYWQVFLLTALAGNGICWINTVCYLICIRNFSSDSRIVFGISTSYAGLSPKVYTALTDAIFRPEHDHKAKEYLLLNAICPLLVASVAAPLLKANEIRKEGSSNGSFLVMFVITLATVACSVLGSIGSVSSGIWSKEHVISLCLLLLAPLLIPAFIKLREGIDNKKERRVHDLTIDEDGKEDAMVVFELKGEEEEKVETGFLLMLRKIDFWLYFFSYMFGATLGMVFLNNLGQISESRGLSHTSSLVSLSSSFGFFGRLMPSLFDFFLSKRGFKVSRPGFMVIMMALIAGTFFFLLNTSNLILYVGTAIIGACSGAITSIAVSATPELFGSKNFAVNHNIVVMNIPIGSFLFGFLAAILYQRGGGGRRSMSCIGAECYSRSFIIWGSVCSLGTLLCTALYVRTRRVRKMAERWNQYFFCGEKPAEDHDPSSLVSVEAVERGFQVEVTMEKNHPDLLAFVLEAFEDLGLEVQEANASCTDKFDLNAVLSQNQNESVDAAMVKEKVLQAIENCLKGNH